MNHNTLNTKQVLEILPHRYPFLMIDKVIDYDNSDPGGYVVAVKNFTVNEPYVQGHFPHYKIMPGVMLMEAMAQASTILVYKQVEVKKDVKKIMQDAGDRSGVLFVGAENVKFKRVVYPGDQLIIHTNSLRNKRNLCEFEAYITVDDHVVASVSKLKAVYKFDNQIKPWEGDEYSK
jgi:3-hydroxyacyl-[acyl-carrier-protein] dehydratase